MQNKGSLERFINYLVITGFLIFGTGVAAYIINQFVRSGLPIELTMILTGLAMIVLGIFAAKILGDVLRWKA